MLRIAKATNTMIKRDLCTQSKNIPMRLKGKTAVITASTEGYVSYWFGI